MTTCTPQKLITWSDRYSVGLSEIDDQHQKLIDLLNELHAAMLAGKGAAVLGKTLEGLAFYTTTHFAHEERLMKRHAFPGYAEHKAEHDKLVMQVRQLQADFRSGKACISQEVMTFLQHWLISHIMSVDKKYSEHLKKAGEK
jgi:hemerythrin